MTYFRTLIPFILMVAGLAFAFSGKSIETAILVSAAFVIMALRK